MFSRGDNMGKKGSLNSVFNKRRRHRKHDDTKIRMEKAPNATFGKMRGPVPIVVGEIPVEGDIHKANLPNISSDVLPSTSTAGAIENAANVKVAVINPTEGEKNDEENSDDYLDTDPDEIKPKDEGDIPDKGDIASSMEKVAPEDSDTDSNFDDTCLYKCVKYSVFCSDCTIL